MALANESHTARPVEPQALHSGHVDCMAGMPNIRRSRSSRFFIKAIGPICPIAFLRDWTTENDYLKKLLPPALSYQMLSFIFFPYKLFFVQSLLNDGRTVPMEVGTYSILNYY